jgi:hypothetical protein
LELTVDGSKSESSSVSTESVGSNIAGAQVNVITGGGAYNADGSVNAANDTTFKVSGSAITAGEINVSTGNIDVSASQNTEQSQSEQAGFNASVSQTAWGAVAGGPSVNVGVSKGESRSSSTTHTNSEINAQTINLAAANDARFNGASVNATDTFNADIAGDLTVESVQDRASSRSKNASANVGLSFGGNTTDGVGSNGGRYQTSAVGKTDGVEGVSGGISSASSMSLSRDTVVSSITSNGEANINVGGKTEIVGAVVATVGENGNDLGNLNLTTGELVVEDLSDSRISSESGFSVSGYLSVGGKDNAGEDSSEDTARTTPQDATSREAPDGQGGNQRLDTVSAGATNNSGVERSTVMGTLGEGNITVDGDSNPDLAGINRDTSETELDLFAVERTAGVDLELDTRVLTQAGRQEIKNDVRGALDTLGTLGRALGTVGQNLDPAFAAQLGDAGERAVNALMVAGKLSEAEANQFLRDNPEVVEVLALVNEDAQLAAEIGFDTPPPLTTQSASSDAGSDNPQPLPESANTDESNASAKPSSDDDYPVYEVVVTAEQLSVVENVGVTLGKGQRVMDDLAEENPTAALLVGVAIAGALGGPVKGAVAVLADQAVQAAAGEEIEAFEEALTNEMGTAITRPNESTEEFSANVADDPDGSDALIQDGSRFVLGTVIGIVSGKKFAGSKKGEGNADSREIPDLETGDVVYRVYGGDSKADGASWTTTDPSKVQDFRSEAGLPSGGASGASNTGQFVIEGKVVDPSKVVIKRPAQPLDGNSGGLPEYIIPDGVKKGAIKVEKVSGSNPEK